MLKLMRKKAKIILKKTCFKFKYVYHTSQKFIKTFLLSTKTYINATLKKNYFITSSINKIYVHYNLEHEKNAYIISKFKKIRNILENQLERLLGYIFREDYNVRDSTLSTKQISINLLIHVI